MARLKQYLPIALAFVACLAALAMFDWTGAWSVLSNLDIGLVLLIEAALVLLVFAVCAVRWVAVACLPATFATLSMVYAYVSVSIAVAMATPMQAGELIKVKFARASGLPLAVSAINIVVERALDIAALGALAMLGLVLRLVGSPSLAILAGLAVMAAGAGIPGFVTWLARRYGKTERGRRAGLTELAIPPGRLAVAVSATAVKWLLTAYAWHIIIVAVGIEISFAQSALVVSMTTFVTLASLVPSGIGVQELSVRAALVLLGADPIKAEAAALAPQLVRRLLL